MKQIALVGTQLIHTYPYLVHFNGSTRELIEKNAKPWMQQFMLDQDLSARTDAARVSRVWSADAEENGRLAETFGIDNVCGTLDEALDGADCAMVMDDVIESRTDIVEKCLAAGIHVFADKILSIDPQKTITLLGLAEEMGVHLRAWSQVFFADEWDAFRDVGPGGVAFLSYSLLLDRLSEYVIHAIVILQRAFGSLVRAYRALDERDGRLALLELRNKTRVLLALGPDLPDAGRLEYRVKGSAVVVDTYSYADAFRNAAKAAEDIFFGRPCMVGPEEMVEASRLAELVVAGGTEGREILICK